MSPALTQGSAGIPGEAADSTVLLPLSGLSHSSGGKLKSPVEDDGCPSGAKGHELCAGCLSSRLTCQGLQVSPKIMSDTQESRRQEKKMLGSHGPLEIRVGPAPRCHSGPCPWEEPGSLQKALLPWRRRLGSTFDLGDICNDPWEWNPSVPAVTEYILPFPTHVVEP